MLAVERLLSEVLALPERERPKFAHRLLESLEEAPTSEVEAVWREELERRVRDVESGAVKPIRWATTRASIVAELRARRAARHAP
ncbi:MAG TPA: addiction module protein [Microbacterium sp.]|nr:addiction module protein [Microbacterium sp.]